jgi:acylphosphatase
MSESAARQRRTIHFRGRVQGVGFRFATRRIAASHAVSGYVQNLFDGSVLLVAEGTTAELDRFLDEIGSTMDRYIESVQSETGPATGEFSAFEVRH